MSSNNFEEKGTMQANQYAKSWAEGYNACLEATNAAGLYEALNRAKADLLIALEMIEIRNGKSEIKAKEDTVAYLKYIDEALAKADNQ